MIFIKQYILLLVFSLTWAQLVNYQAPLSHIYNINKIEFYLMRPHNKKEATFGNGTMITFSVDSKKGVDSFYNLALKLGAVDEGKPGPRHYEHYYAYFRDLDGNKICAFCSD